MTDAAALAGFTPVSLALASGAASIDWGDLAGWRFSDPFFDQTVERWAGSAAPRLVRTGLDALEALDDAPSLDPTALIFHLSRCGSTLVSRLLSRLPGTLVVAEPKPVNTLLLADPAALGEAEAARLLRRLVRALGRRRFGDEHCYVLKLSSWNIVRLDLFRRAFPEAKVIWVQRRPLDIMSSLLADPPGWLALHQAPREAEHVFALSPDDLHRLDVTGFCVQALAALLAAACGIDGASLVVDYRELPEAVWTRVAPFLGLAPGAGEIALLREEARYYAKDPARRLFTGDPPERRALSDALRALAATELEPLYRILDARR